MLSYRERLKNLESFENSKFDLAIIGGGITGAGVARDAASRGLKVALVEAADFASGTSSRSSKLIHGGIRYLENLEFHLVFEALSERQRLFDLAPHLVHPLRFLLPLYKGGRVPAWKMGLGMWLYDALSLFEAPELNRYLDPAEVAQEFPAMQSKDLEGAFAYYDAYMDDDRLVHETLRSAATFGARFANYTKVDGVEILDGKVRALKCKDQFSGKTFNLKARHFVGSVGPWTDILGQDLFKTWKKTLRPSKGVHLTFSKRRFQLHDAVVMGAESRIVFAIPRHEMVIVGTTDTDYPGDPAKVRTEKEDVDYLLGVIDRYFPGAKITRKDILGCYAGVRPLIYDGAETESKTSREHAIWSDPRGVTFVAGGKYTTYRNMAEQTVEHVLKTFSIEERVQYRNSQTLQPLNPQVSPELLSRALEHHGNWAAHFGLPESITFEIAERHGLEGETLIERAKHLLNPTKSAEEWLWCAEAIHAVEQTMCLSLTDFYFRRTHLVLARADHGMPFAPAIANAMGELLGWDAKAKDEQINALQNHLASELHATIPS